LAVTGTFGEAPAPQIDRPEGAESANRGGAENADSVLAFCLARNGADRSNLAPSGAV